MIWSTQPIRNHQGEDILTTPNVFVIGAPRAGTTSFFDYLTRHPEIEGTEPKEPHFFSSHKPWVVKEMIRGRTYAQSEAQYNAKFSCESAKYVVDASTSYLYAPGTAERVHRHCPESHIFALLRDPIERAHSHYWLYRRWGPEERSFSDAINEAISKGGLDRYISPGCYGTSIERWMSHFPRDQIHIVESKDLFSEPQPVTRDVYDLLGLDYSRDLLSEIGKQRNSTFIPRNLPARLVLGNKPVRQISRKLFPSRFVDFVRDKFLTEGRSSPTGEVVQVLERLFRPEIEKAERLLNRDLVSLKSSHSEA